ncbi:hypothetical protein KJE20_14288 [Pyrenophora tritici-repentis]|nr:hypothetical protein KJE20_14288 [Pyrenophora tritici-repentis]
MLQDSLAHLCNARDIYKVVFKNTTSISEEAKRGFWIYQDLARGISNCFNCASFGPVPKHWSTLLPEGNVGQFSERVYWTKVNLRVLLDALSDFARPYLPQMREMDEEALCALGSVANQQIKMLEEWRSNLISRLTWSDTEPLSTDPLIASLRTEYYEGMAKLLRPYVGIAEYALHSYVHSPEDRLSNGQQDIVKVFLNWEKYALLTVECFDRVGAASDSMYETCQTKSGSSMMLSNPVSALHTEFKIVFLFRVIRSSANYPLIAEQTKVTAATIDALRRRTIKRLSEFGPIHPILSRDLEALNRLWLPGDSVPLMELVRAYDLV